MDFSGKNVWVTGAGKGIGYATALAFVEAGAKVTGFDQAFSQEQYPFCDRSNGCCRCCAGGAGMSATVS